MTFILMNNKLLIRIKDIYTFISRIYKSIESDHNDRSINVICYILLKSTILKIKNIK